MRRGNWAGVGIAGLCLLAACSGGGSSSAAKTTTTVSSTTTTTPAPTSTTTPEDAVKQAYLDYWKMIDRILAAPDPNDPEISQRAADPLFSSLRDQLTTSKATGHHTSVPQGNTNTHRIDSVQVTGASAQVTECFVDGRVEFGPNGEVVDGATVTKVGHASLTLSADQWKVADIRFDQRTPGVSGCAA